MTKIGFLGPRGTFSHEALEEYIKDSNDFIPQDYNNISDMIMAVQNGIIDEGIAPIENSIEGAVNATLDMLAFEVDLKIKSELVIPINQNLLIKKGAKLEDIKYVLSHPQPVGQCRKYINANFPSAEVRLVYSTAGAAETVAAGTNDSAAIGSAAAARVYGLDIAARGIQDEENNLTRFVIMSKADNPKTGDDKTSIVFSTEDKPGSLYSVLEIFNLWDINLTRIESRPAKNQLGKYIFFVDISGHKEDDDVRDALTMVKRKTSFCKFLGSYAVYRNEHI